MTWYTVYDFILCEKLSSSSLKLNSWVQNKSSIHTKSTVQYVAALRALPFIAEKL